MNWFSVAFPLLLSPHNLRQTVPGDDNPAIINGIPVTNRRPDFRHLARIVMTKTGVGSGQCTGSLIGPRLVLTAGHCLVYLTM
jgi:secreted trypsin-like serine protease